MRYGVLGDVMNQIVFALSCDYVLLKNKKAKNNIMRDTSWIEEKRNDVIVLLLLCQRGCWRFKD